MWTSCTWHIAYYYSNSKKNPSKNGVTSHKGQRSVSLTFWVVSNSITELANEPRQSQVCLAFTQQMSLETCWCHPMLSVLTRHWPLTDPLVYQYKIHWENEKNKAKVKNNIMRVWIKSNHIKNIRLLVISHMAEVWLRWKVTFLLVVLYFDEP